MKYETELVDSKVNIQLTELAEDDIVVSSAGRNYRPQRMTVHWSTSGSGDQYVSWTVHAQLIRKSDGKLSDTWMELSAVTFAKGSMDRAVFDEIAREVAARLSPPTDEAQAAKERVRAFLEARREVTRAPRGGLTKDIIYSVGTMDGTVELLLADLEKLVEGSKQ